MRNNNIVAFLLCLFFVCSIIIGCVEGNTKQITTRKIHEKREDIISNIRRNSHLGLQRNARNVQGIIYCIISFITAYHCYLS